MKALINCVLGATAAVFIFGFIRVILHLNDPPEAAGQIKAWELGIFLGGGVAFLITYFIRSRINDRIGLLKVTERDRKEIEEFRRTFNPINVLAQLLVSAGGVLILAGFFSFMSGMAPGSHVRWWVALLIIGPGIGVILLGVFVAGFQKKK